MISPHWCAFWARAVRSGGWEDTLREAAVAACGRRRVAVDGGAHLGAWAIPLAAVFASVVCFEPCGENRECLEANVAHLGNVAVLPLALSDREHELRLALPARPGVNSGMWRAAEAGQPATAIPLDRLDLRDLDLLKLDLEGWELRALVGARDTIRRCRPVVVIEENGSEAQHGIAAGAARGFLIGLGYRIAFTTKDNLVMVPKDGGACG